MKVTHNLLLIIIVAVFLTMGIIAGGVYHLGSTITERTLTNQLTSVQTLKASQLNLFLDEEEELTENFAHELAYILSLTNSSAEGEEQSDSYNSIRERLTRFIALEEDVSKVLWLDTKGRVVLASEEGEEGKILAAETFFIKGMEGSATRSFNYDTTSQEATLTLSVPIKDDLGSVLGVLVTLLEAEAINSIMAERTGLGESGETYLVSKAKILITDSRFKQGATFHQVVNTQGTQICLTGREGYGRYLNYLGVEVLGAYSWIPELETCLLAEQTVEEGFQGLRDVMSLIGFIGVSLSLISLISFFWIAHIITNPLVELAKTIEAVSRGDMSTRISKRLTERDNEIGRLARAFDRTITSIKLAMRSKQGGPRR